MSGYQDRIQRGQREWGEQFDSSEMDACPQFHPFYGTMTRIKVASGDFVRTGVVTSTTGWRPALMLKFRSNMSGSWDLLGPTDRIVAVWDGRKYRELAHA